jgi:hypothetical protein
LRRDRVSTYRLYRLSGSIRSGDTAIAHRVLEVVLLGAIRLTISLNMRYLNGPTGDLVDSVLASESSGGTVAWYLPDRLGTVRDLINNSGPSSITMISVRSGGCSINPLHRKATG